MPLILEAQSKFIGHFKNSFGDDLYIRSDSFFDYERRYDMYLSWTFGEWKVRNDTIYLYMIPLFDTLNVINEDGLIKDTLLLSVNKIRERVSKAEITYSGGQNKEPCPEKLLYRRDKLFLIESNGKINKKKFKHIWTGKNHTTHFTKQTISKKTIR